MRIDRAGSLCPMAVLPSLLSRVLVSTLDWLRAIWTLFRMLASDSTLFCRRFAHEPKRSAPQTLNACVPVRELAPKALTSVLVETKRFCELR